MPRAVDEAFGALCGIVRALSLVIRACDSSNSYKSNDDRLFEKILKKINIKLNMSLFQKRVIKDSLSNSLVDNFLIY